MQYHIGIGSWADPEYKKLLVAPPGVPAKDRLRAYAAWFDHVELNLTYYKVPSPKQAEDWIAQTPDGFSFDFKLHQLLSQDPARAGTDERLIASTIAGARPLIEARRLGCFFIVLPPSFTPSKHRLEELDALADKLAPYPVAVELRHRGWVTGEQREKTFAYFRQHGLVLISVDMPQIDGSTILPPIDEVTREDVAYMRLHGRNPHYLQVKTAEEKHTYAYSDAEIAEIAERARRLATKAKHVHVIANNHAEDFAPKAALALQRLLRPDRQPPAAQQGDLQLA
jgi:uncharacterized protein YecE (DUF72 family)